MKAETTKAMQDALEAAVGRMSNGHGGSASSAAPPNDLMGALMSVLPKLLNNGNDDDLLEELDKKVDELRKGDIVALREQVLILRKQCHRVLKGQEEILAAIQDIQKQQNAVSDVIIEIADHVTRIPVVGNLPPVVDDQIYGRPAVSVPDSQVRGGAVDDQRRPRQKAAKNMNRARS